MTKAAFRQTPSQTVGPFFAYGLTPAQYGYPHNSIAGPVLVEPATSGQRIRLTGQVLDGAGVPIPDALIELWQADGQGRFAHPADPRGSNIGFIGFGRCGTGTDPSHRYWFDTIKPGAAGPGEAPFLSLIVLMRGLLSHAYTRVYFADEVTANASDPVLVSVPPERRATLLARPEDLPGGRVYHFDIHMQGPAETVFFDV